VLVVLNKKKEVVQNAFSHENESHALRCLPFHEAMQLKHFHMRESFTFQMLSLRQSAFKLRKLSLVCIFSCLIFSLSQTKYWISVTTVRSLIQHERRGGKNEDGNKLSPALTTKLSESSVYSHEKRGRVPILITSMGGSGTTFLANSLKLAGIKVLHEAVGEHGTVGWWQLFNLNQLRVWEKLIMLNRTDPMQSLKKLRKLCESGGIWVRTGGGRYKKPCQKGDELYFEPYVPSSQDHPIYYEKVFHQVRDPLKTISSFSKYCGHTQLWKMACSITPGLTPYWIADRQKSTRYRNNFKTCTRFMMYHWVSWNEKIALHADWTYRIENTSSYSICTRAYSDHADILEKCNSELIQKASKQGVRRNSKQFADRVELEPHDLYRLDCKLARSVFVAAVSYGYGEYVDKIKEC